MQWAGPESFDGGQVICGAVALVIWEAVLRVQPMCGLGHPTVPDNLRQNTGGGDGRYEIIPAGNGDVPLPVHDLPVDQDGYVVGDVETLHRLDVCCAQSSTCSKRIDILCIEDGETPSLESQVFCEFLEDHFTALGAQLLRVTQSFPTPGRGDYHRTGDEGTS